VARRLLTASVAEVTLLSKSQARTFFIVFTGGFSLAFLGLTVDTVRAVPERSHEADLTDSARRGKHLWEDNNCMGCHTILGEGAYYAPELTKVVSRRGATWIDLFLQDPEKMFPGQRKMVKYDFTAADRQDLIAFLTWIGNVDTNGFPPAPDMTLTGKAPAPAASSSPRHDPLAGAPTMFKTVCVACHAVGGVGGNTGPALDGVADRYTPEALERWLADPQAVKPGTAMPNLNLSDDVRQALVQWLRAPRAQETPR
jgi:nitric oxide reductase subunit C